MKFLARSFALFVMFLLYTQAATCQDRLPVFYNTSGQWADSVLNSMSLDEKIGQLFMVAAYSNRNEAHVNELAKLIETYKIGGLIFFQGGPLRQAHMTNKLQAKSDIPLWIGMDLEWGLAMRLDSTIKYPRQMTLGALENDSLIYAMGYEIGRQCKRLGIHINFAPVVDINNNPKNPVINSRSFGQNKLWVTQKSLAYMQGMQDAGILANAKHFPGHGDTDMDSHKSLPTISHSVERLKEVELYPYSKLFKEGLASVMVAHLSVPALDSADNRASTLSPEIVTGLLKNEMGFKGLAFTDALNMKGVSKYYKPGELDLLAAQAGNDVLLFAEDVPKAMAAIKEAILKDEYSEESLNASVKKILLAKEWLGLTKTPRIETKNLYTDLNRPEALQIKKELSEASITLAKNDQGLVPFLDVEKDSYGLVTIGKNSDAFEDVLSKHLKFSQIDLASDIKSSEGLMVRDSLGKKSVLIILVEGTNNRPSKNFGLTDSAIQLIVERARDQKVVLVHMGSPYALEKIGSFKEIETVVIGFQDDPYLSAAAANALTGAIPANGRLPVSVGDWFSAQTGYETININRLEYPIPGFDDDRFYAIDSIVKDGMKMRAYPGAQVLVAQHGKVLYNKSFGYHTYENTRKVENEDIYDIASITKVVASTLSLMKLQDEGKFDLDMPIGKYLEEIPKGNPYYQLTSREILAHVAGLKPWIPFYMETMDKGVPKWDIYSTEPTDQYTFEVVRKMYINKNFPDSIIHRIISEPLRKNKDYKYSDLGYYFMKEIIQRQSGMPLEEYVAAIFYEPMGLFRIGYLPLANFDKDEIVPTEYDTYFRNQLVHGYVHDPGAAMLGGVGGHAGVFSNAENLAAILQMLLNKGLYGGKRYLSKEVIEEYTACQYCEGDEEDEKRRGAGFDKPVMGDGPGPTCKCVSFDSFGHSGFTGTLAWADPQEEIVYIFLSNRVYPSAENNKLAKYDIRTKIQSEIYKVLATKPDSLSTALVE
jgi:beta-glucosidase-like glycosyl hydrolase/CubicO group peptidase (beta-lactamase class C family)